MVSLFTRAPLGVIFLLLGLVLSARLGMVAISEQLQTRRPAVSAALDGSNITSRLSLAKDALDRDPPGLEAARSAAEEALASNPLSTPALQLLAAVAEEEGRLEDIRTLMRQAASITLRNSLNQLWAFSNALESGQRDTLMALIDRIYATTGRFGPIEPHLHLLIADEAGLAAVAAALAGNPSWRGPILGAFLRHSRDHDRYSTLFERLAATEAPPTNAEIRSLLTALVAAGRLDQALFVWRTHVVNAYGADLDALLPNANFEAGLLNMPFEWTARTDVRAAVRLTRESRRRVLNIDFFGGRVGANMVGRVLVLSPGSYVLRGAERAVGFATPRGLVWRLSCAGQSASLAETAPLTGETGWRPFEARFTVPEACRYQMLELTLLARAPSEQEIRGLVSYADFSLERVD